MCPVGFVLNSGPSVTSSNWKSPRVSLLVPALWTLHQHPWSLLSTEQRRTLFSPLFLPKENYGLTWASPKQGAQKPAAKGHRSLQLLGNGLYRAGGQWSRDLSDGLDSHPQGDRQMLKEFSFFHSCELCLRRLNDERYYLPVGIITTKYISN